MKRPIICLVALAAFGGLPAWAQSLSLAGQWRFELDRTDAGIGAQWFAKALSGSIRLPGSLPAQGIGDDVSASTPWIEGVEDRSWFDAPEYARYRQPVNVKIPFWLQPNKYYVGAAWYQRDIDVPVAWAAKRVVLSLERPHWETRVWVDTRAVGAAASLATPHEYDLGELPTGRHVLTIRVDNRMIVDIGENSHAISDQTQGDWNGIEGRIELRATPIVWIEDLQLYPLRGTSSVAVRGRIGNASGLAGKGRVRIVSGSQGKVLDVAWAADGGSFDTAIDLGGDATPWDEFSPALHELSAELDNGAEAK